MENLSVENKGATGAIRTSQSKTDNFSALEREYITTKTKLEKSDFSNSPVAIEKELSMIAKLKVAAQKQGLSDKVRELDDREKTLYTKLANYSSPEPSGVYYHPVSFRGNMFLGKKPSDDVLDYTQDRFIKFFAQGFENDEVVKYNLQSMCDMGIDINAAISILEAIKVKDPQSGLHHINQDTFKKLITVKKLFSTTSNKEKEEYNSPINQVGMQVFSVGKDTIIFKNGKVQYITPVEGKSVQCMQEEYDKAVSDEEDKILYDFAKKYSDKEGKIDSIYLRVLSQLRQSGVVKNQILSLTDMCISPDGEINKDVMSTVMSLKRAGALSSDIKKMTESFNKDENGLFDKRDVANAIALTKSVMTGEEAVSFLPAMRTGDEASEYIINFSRMFNPEHVKSLVNIVSDKNSIPDEDAMDVVNSVLRNPSIADEKGEINAEDFVKIARHMVGVAKDFNTSESVNEDAVELIFQMCRSAFPLADIESVLSRCLNEEGKIDKTLAKILWHMTWDSHNIPKMNEVLDVCVGDSYGASENKKNILKYLEDNT